MKKEFSKADFLRVFTIVVFIILASIDNSVLDMASSVYYFMKPAFVSAPITPEKLAEMEIYLGFVNSLLIWIVAGLALYWGYLGDKGNRKRLLLIGTAIWSASLAFTPLVFNIISWLIVQCFAGVGLACIASVGFSVIVDFVSPERRGLALSFWGLSQGVGTILGKGLAAVIVKEPSQWWWPFFSFSIIGFIMIGLYFFTLDPKRGATESELKNTDYDYKIKRADLGFILRKRTNLALMLQGLTAQVVWGSLTWLPFVFTQKVVDQGLPQSSGGLVGNIIAGLFGIGGIFSILFGALGDRLQKKTLKARPLISAVTALAGIPLFMVMLLVPFDLSAIVGVTGTFPLIGALLNQLVVNPLFALMFWCSIAAAAFMNASSPNWFALIGDVNLPEHRGTVFGLGNLVNGIGRGIGSIVLPVISTAFLVYYPNPWNYLWSLVVVQLFFIPTGICYWYACRHVEHDYMEVRTILAERAATSKANRDEKPAA
nr:MFS transporter [Candidatus Sigynarchaeota archaeon]